MTNSFPKWITKRMIKGARGFNLDSYLVALEGWRRGLTLTWYYDPAEVTDMTIIGFNPLGKTFSLESNEQQMTHYFYRSRGDKVSNEAADIVHQKHQAKTYFNKSGVPTPKGIMFDRNTEEDAIIERVESLKYPVVLKPVLGSLGKGVITNIHSEEELFDAIKNVQDQYDGYNQYIVEEQFDGDEYRVYVIGDKVAAATKRVPANVVGDGVHSIEQLIEEKNKQKRENPYLNKKLIKLDDTVLVFLKKQGLDSGYIPENGEMVKLRGQANISAGGDPIDATDNISEKVEKVAIAAVRAIPELIHAGVDIIADDKEIKVIEVNGTADISMHVFPIEGSPQNVPEKIIDFYYPSTIGSATDRTEIFFSYMDIRNILRDKLAQKITISDAPNGTLHTTRYIVSGKVQKVGYRIWIRNQAIKRGLHGYTRNLKNGNVVVIVGGSNRNDVEDFKKTCYKGPAKAKVENVRE